MSLRETSSCDLCKKEIKDISFSIPLDENWQRISGIYCSKWCARYDNRFYNRGKRSIDEWEQRDIWFTNKHG